MSEQAKSGKDSGWPSEWPEWVKVTLRELERSERRFMEAIGWKDVPGWVAAMTFECLKVIDPAAKFAKVDVSGSRYLGRLLGYYEGLVAEDGELVRLLEKCPIENRQMRRMMRKLERSEAGRKKIAEMKRVFWALARVCIGKARIVAKTLRKVQSVTRTEAAEFHAGYAEGLQCKLCTDDSNVVMTPVPIYWVMVLNWRFVRRMPSTFVLYEWLCKVLGARRVGGYERVREICKRYGIRFRGRGRPSKKLGRGKR